MYIYLFIFSLVVQWSFYWEKLLLIPVLQTGKMSQMSHDTHLIKQ